MSSEARSEDRAAVSVSVTAIESFSAAHRLRGYEGDCARSHGHNYRVEVTATRRERYAPLDEQGFVVDGAVLKRAMRSVLGDLDHQDLVDGSGPVTFGQATAEIMAMWIREQLDDLLPEGVLVSKVRLWETDDLFAEVSL